MGKVLGLWSLVFGREEEIRKYEGRRMKEEGEEEEGRGRGRGTLQLIAAWAAARRATGTLGGEQLT